MPELPEVEAARKAVHESCCGRRILEANVANDTIVIDSIAPSVLENALVGRTILGAQRKGKNLWLELDARPWPSFQFGMTGAFHIKGKEITKYKRSAVSDKEEWPSKFAKVFLKLDDGLEVSFTDKRRLARVRLRDDPVAAPPISELGPDAYLELPEETTFISSILKKRCPIKALIMDQSFIAGIGNWVADEVLYQARIHPEQVASSLSESECMRLHKSIREVLKLSVDVNADSELFPKDWIFHYRWNKKPGEVGGERIAFITVGGRTSAIVPAFQKCTSQSSRKKNNAINLQIEEDNGAENATADIKKKRGRKEQTKKADASADGEDLDASPVPGKNKSMTKESLPANKAESRKGRGSKNSSSKEVVEEEKKESKLAVSKGKKTSKATTFRDVKKEEDPEKPEEEVVEGEKESKSAVSKGKKTRKAMTARDIKQEDDPEKLLKLSKKQEKAPAKKRSGKKELTEEARTSTEAEAHIEKVVTKPSAKSSKKVEAIEKELKVEKGEGSNASKKEVGQKRKRVVK